MRALGVRGTKPPLTLNTATSPTNKADPGGTSLMRNSFSLSGAGSIVMLHLQCARVLTSGAFVPAKTGQQVVM